MKIEIAYPNQLKQKDNPRTRAWVNSIQKNESGFEAIETKSGTKYLRMPNGQIRRVR